MAKLGKFSVFVGVLLLASGCASGPSHSGAAATIGSSVIKQDVVTAQLNEVMPQIAQSQSQSQTQPASPPPSAATIGQAIVNRLIIAELVDRAVIQLKIKITDSQVQQFKNQVYSQYGQVPVENELATTQGLPASQVDSLFKTVLGEGLIGSAVMPNGTQQQRSQATGQYLLMVGSSTKIEVAPRYGTWDPSHLASVGTDDSLSTLNVTGQ